MPYYFDDDMDDQYWDKVDADPGYEVPESMFRYVEPWQANATVVSFRETPGPEPKHGQRASGQPGLFARLFGAKPDPAPGTQQPSAEDHLESIRREQEAAVAHALWKVATLAARCRNQGVKRVFASYDGGGDESFIYLTSVEMRDGRTIAAELLRAEAGSCKQLAETAVFAVMGRFDAGSFQLHGAVTIDLGACTITDEKNADVVFGDKTPWEA